MFIILFSIDSSAEQEGDTSSDIFKNLSGGTPFSLGVQDSVLKALENNPIVAIQRLEPQKAMTGVDMLRSAFDPSVSLSANKSKTKTEAQLGTNVEPIQLTTDRTRISLDVSEALPTGTTLDLLANMNAQWELKQVRELIERLP